MYPWVDVLSFCSTQKLSGDVRGVLDGIDSLSSYQRETSQLWKIRVSRARRRVEQKQNTKQYWLVVFILKQLHDGMVINQKGMNMKIITWSCAELITPRRNGKTPKLSIPNLQALHNFPNLISRAVMITYDTPIPAAPATNGRNQFSLSFIVFRKKIKTAMSCQCQSHWIKIKYCWLGWQEVNSWSTAIWRANSASKQETRST